MVRRGNLAVFESSSISETRIATSTKIGVHAFDTNLVIEDGTSHDTVESFGEEKT